MNDDIKDIAMRIKDLRDIYNISLETLARDLGIDQKLYQQYENGDADIPIGVLKKIAEKFNVEFITLITGRVPHLNRYSVVKKGKGISVERRKEYDYQDIAYGFTNKKAQIFLVTVKDRTNESDLQPNSHDGHEFNYVLEGALKVHIDDKEILLEEGDSLYFDSKCKHYMTSVDGKPARIIAVVL
ncbi:MAG: helix-turn-helix domain-containing protein [Endomicrobiaceae bacterium]